MERHVRVFGRAYDAAATCQCQARLHDRSAGHRLRGRCAGRVDMLLVLMLVLGRKVAVVGQRQPDLAVYDAQKRLAQAQREQEHKRQHRLPAPEAGAPRHYTALDPVPSVMRGRGVAPTYLNWSNQCLRARAAPAKLWQSRPKYNLRAGTRCCMIRHSTMKHRDATTRHTFRMTRLRR